MRRAGQGQAGVPVPRADSPAFRRGPSRVGLHAQGLRAQDAVFGSTSGRGLPDVEAGQIPAANGGAGSGLQRAGRARTARPPPGASMRFRPVHGQIASGGLLSPFQVQDASGQLASPCPPPAGRAVEPRRFRALGHDGHFSSRRS